jgi:hypothetical protein
VVLQPKPKVIENEEGHSSSVVIYACGIERNLSDMVSDFPPATALTTSGADNITIGETHPLSYRFSISAYELVRAGNE